MNPSLCPTGRHPRKSARPSTSFGARWDCQSKREPVVLNRVGEATLNQYGAARRPMDSPEAAYLLWRGVVAEDPAMNRKRSIS